MTHKTNYTLLSYLIILQGTTADPPICNHQRKIKPNRGGKGKIKETSLSQEGVVVEAAYRLRIRSRRGKVV